MFFTLIILILRVENTEADDLLYAGSTRCLLLRDTAVINMLWDSCLRGKDVGKLKLANLRTTVGGPLLPSLSPRLLLKTGDSFLVSPHGVKNRYVLKPFLSVLCLCAGAKFLC